MYHTEFYDLPKDVDKVLDKLREKYKHKNIIYGMAPCDLNDMRPNTVYIYVGHYTGWEAGYPIGAPYIDVIDTEDIINKHREEERHAAERREANERRYSNIASTAQSLFPNDLKKMVEYMLNHR